MRFVIRESGTHVSQNEAKQLASLGIEILVVQENASESLLCSNISAKLCKMAEMGRDEFYIKKRNEALDEDFFHRNLEVEGDIIRPRFGAGITSYLSDFLMIATVYASRKGKTFTVKFNNWEQKVNANSAVKIGSLVQDYRKPQTLPGKDK